MNQLKFTGGDELQGIAKFYHNIIMFNELNGGYGAYQLQWAGGNSGPSFGGNQMDIAHNQKARKLLLEICQQLGPASQQVRSILKQQGVALRKHPSKLFGEQLLQQINLVLASQEGRSRINASYVQEISQRSSYIEEIIAAIRHPAAQRFYQSRHGRGLLFDYHNQFFLSKNGPLMRYINGQETKLQPHHGRSVAFGALDFGHEYSLGSHYAFIYSTQYAVHNSHDLSRRLQHIKILALGHLP